MSPVQNKDIRIIVAIGENNAIGKDNKLLWRLSADLQRFKKITTGHTVIMGRNTFLSLPKGALPDRKNVVITNIENEQFPGCESVYSIEEAMASLDEGEIAFIIGGGMVYRQFLPHARKLYITRVHSNFEADTFFPEFNYDEWMELERESHESDEKNEYPYTFIIYERK